jgi:hypothetical protein
MVLDGDALGSFSDRVVREWEDAASLGLFWFEQVDVSAGGATLPWNTGLRREARVWISSATTTCSMWSGEEWVPDRGRLQRRLLPHPDARRAGAGLVQAGARAIRWEPS